LILDFGKFLHLWWPLLLCRVIVNNFHPATYKGGKTGQPGPFCLDPYVGH